MKDNPRFIPLLSTTAKALWAHKSRLFLESLAWGLLLCLILAGLAGMGVAGVSLLGFGELNLSIWGYGLFWLLGSLGLFSAWSSLAWFQCSYLQNQHAPQTRALGLPLLQWMAIAMIISALIVYALFAFDVPSPLALFGSKVSSPDYALKQLSGGLAALIALLGSIGVSVTLPAMTVGVPKPWAWSLKQISANKQVFSGCLAVSLLFYALLLGLGFYETAPIMGMELFLGWFSTLFLGILWAEFYFPTKRELPPNLHARKDLTILLLTGLLGLGLFAWADQNNAQRLAALSADIQLVEKKLLEQKRTRPAIFGETLAGDAKQAYLSLLKNPLSPAYEVQAKHIDDMYIVPKDAKSEFFTANAVIQPRSEILQQYSPHFEKLKIATHSAEFSSLYTDFDVNTPLPNFINAQRLGKLLLVQATLDLQRGAQKQGYERFFEGLRLGQDLRTQANLIGTMLGIVIQADATKSYLTTLSPNTVELQLAQTLLCYWQILHKEQAQGIGLPLQIEKLSLQKIILKPEDFIKTTDQKPALSGIQDWLTAKLILPVLLHTEAHLNRIMTRKIALYSRIPYERSPSEIRAFNDFVLKEIEKNEFVALGMPNYQGADERIWGNQVRLDLAYLKTALMVYYLQHKSYPNDLHTLVPAVLPSLPVDPYSGKNYRYRRQGQGFEIYSLGPNGKDDFGHIKRSELDLIYLFKG